MTTSARMTALLAAVVLLIGPARSDDPKTPKPPAATAKVEITDLLRKRISLEKFEGTFSDAIKMLQEKYELPLVLDATLPRTTQDDEPLDKKPIKLPKLTNVPTDAVLRLVCDQVDAMFLVEPGHIRVAPFSIALSESGLWKKGDPITSDGGDESILPVVDRVKYQPAIFRAIVNASFKSKPVSEIVDDIAESTGANVILAPVAAEKAKQALTVRFNNTPVEVAVRTLCEMAELGVIEDTNILIVTTKERATEVATARAKAEETKRNTSVAWRVAHTPVGYGPGLNPPQAANPQPNVVDELARLKEQNEQLKKQLDEIQKSLKK